MQNHPPNTKYGAVWNVDAPLGDWFDRLPEITTLATIKTELQKMAEQWAKCSASSESRTAESGALSDPPCVKEMLKENPLFKELYNFILRDYGADFLAPEYFDEHIANMGKHIAQLISLYGSGVPIQQLQPLQFLPIY